MRLLTLILMMPLLFLPAGCTFSASDTAGANKVVQKCHEALKQKDWDTLFSLYSKSFFEEEPKSAWKSSLTAIFDRLGPLQSAQLDYQQKDSRSQGDYYVYGYTLKFEKGTAKETMTIFKAVGEKPLLIAGHIIRPQSGANR